MTDSKEPYAGEFYKDLQGNLYQIITLAFSFQDREKFVVYQELYGTFSTYVKPLFLFVNDMKKSQNFMEEQTSDLDQFDTKEEDTDSLIETDKKSKDLSGLIAFLDASSCAEKLTLFIEMENNLDQSMLNNIAVSLDLAILEEDLERQKEGIIDYLRTRSRFETKRLR